MTTAAELYLPILRPDQAQIATHPAKIKVLSMGRRWGKTTMGLVIIGNVLAQHGRAAWVVPEYKNGRALWRMLVNLCAPLAQSGIVQISRSERVVTTTGGGFVGIYSADNIDSIRNEWFHLVIGDEAARIDGDGWNDAVRPTLADVEGDEILISTPKGKNWFYEEFLRGERGEAGYMSWTAPTNANPMPSIQRAYELARVRLPERSFRQEWDAQFVDDGVIFKNVYELSVLAESAPQHGHRYIVGVDWGRFEDATVFSVLDARHKKQVCLVRLLQNDFETQRMRLAALARAYNDALCVVESNSIGQAQIEGLREYNLRIESFQMTNASKTQIIEALQYALERKEIALLNDKVQIAELTAFEAISLPSGAMRYTAPAGMHDDTVIALALALYGASTAAPISITHQPQQESKFMEHLSSGSRWKRY